MRFGIFGAAQADSSLSSAPMGQGFHDFIDFNVEAEALGYHSTFLVEHHFTGWIRRGCRPPSRISCRTTMVARGVLRHSEANSMQRLPRCAKK
jgi:hypothetical protein